MGFLSDKCRQMTNLSILQIDILDKLSRSFPLVSDLSHAHLTVYAKVADKDEIVVIAQIEPNTSFSQYRPNILGTTVRRSEEPLVWRTMTTGEAIKGKREWAWGFMLDMYTFAIYDAEGQIIASVSFETNSEELRIEGYNYLIETAYKMLLNAKLPIDKELYRPLSASDGIIITDKRSKIVFANTAVSSIYKVLGVGKMVGHHIFDRQITMHITKETTVSQRPYEKEIEAGNLVLVQRNIPLMKNDQLLRTVIVVSDVTELRKKEKELLIKSAVIQEIHHRVKNNLQTIASLLRLQSRRTNS
ncbi:MAG: signal transduction histidine kinase, partial [Firmicutes bacterium]|nr:signal transduction histidine kinase [Bacillota bacterium]